MSDTPPEGRQDTRTDELKPDQTGTEVGAYESSASPSVGGLGLPAMFAAEDDGPAALFGEFAELWSRGLADEAKLWKLFDVCEMYMQRPNYYGAPVFLVSDQYVTPVFTSEARLAEFMVASGIIDPEDSNLAYDWVRVTGAHFFSLPVRARHLVIDPSGTDGVVVDLASRDNPPPIPDGMIHAMVNLEYQPDNSEAPTAELIRGIASVTRHANSWEA